MAVNGLNFIGIRRGAHQYAMIDRDRQLANDRQAGVLQQIVDVVDPAGAGVFNRHHRVIGLAGFYLIKNIGELRAAALNKLLKVASGVLTRRQMRVRALGTEERHAGRMRVNFIQMLLQQGLLGKNRVFDNQLEQAGDIVRIQIMVLADSHQALQQIAFAVNITHRTMGGQFGFSNLNSQSAALRQQSKQLLVQGAYLIAQRQ